MTSGYTDEMHGWIAGGSYERLAAAGPFHEYLSCTLAFNTALEHPRHYFEKRYFIPWFREECNETCLESPRFKPASRAICRDGDYRNLLSVLMCVDCPCRLITVHSGHVEIHQDQTWLVLDS